MSSLIFARFLRSQVAGDCNKGCQNSATGLRAGFCLGDPLEAPSPSRAPASENVHTLRGHPARYVHLPELLITCGNLIRANTVEPDKRRTTTVNIAFQAYTSLNGKFSYVTAVMILHIALLGRIQESDLRYAIPKRRGGEI